MKLKRIELVGFKSFCNKTDFEFDGGITAVVGPNGCGKSNIVDCINWVLGTLSSKLVRGEEMLDVIFKGTESLPPMAYAQVSLTLDNSDHTLPVPYEEVTVARKIYRSGESEYYINKAVVRLKDVKEMFYNTGLGNDNYSIIEQGKINNMILATPQARRFMFDEVAGISKYKVKRKEALLKLEKVNGDLVRLEDLLKQIESELHSVRIQAGRARKYAEIQDEYKAKRSQLFLHEYKAIFEELSKVVEQKKGVEERSSTIHDRLAAAEKEAGEAEAALKDRVERISTFTSRLSEGKTQISHLNQTIRRLEGFIEDLHRQKSDRDAERSEAIRKQGSLKEQIEKDKAELDSMEARRQTIDQEISDLGQKLDEARKETARVAGELESRKTQAFELAHKESQYRTEVTEIEVSLKGLVKDLEKINGSLSKLESELAELQIQRETKEKEKSSVSGSIKESLERKSQLEDLRAKLEKEMGELNGTIGRLRQERDTKTARRETLHELETKKSGLDSGSRALVESTEGSIKGLVADYMDVEPQFVNAVDAIMSDLQAYVVTDNPENAVAALKRVHENDWGSVGLVSLGKGADLATLHPEMKQEGVLGRAGEFIRFTDEAVGTALAPILNKYIVVDSIATAVRLNSNEPVVTLEGVVFDGSTITSKKTAYYEKSVLSRRVMIRTLQDEVDKISSELLAQEKMRDDVGRRLDETKHELENIRHAVYEKQIELKETTDSIEGLFQRETFLKKEIDTLKIEYTTLEDQSKALGQRQSVLQDLLNEMDALKNQMNREVNELTELQKEYAESVQKYQEEQSNLRVEAAAFNQKRDTIKKGIDSMQASLYELDSLLAKFAGMLKQLDDKAAETQAEIEKSRATIESTEKELSTIEASLEKVRGGEEELQASYDQAKAKLDEVEKEYGSMSDERHGVEMKENEHRINLNHLAQRAQEEIQIDLGAEAANWQEPAEIDWKQLTDEVGRLKQRIMSFGAVNMLALEKLRELEEREAFLKNNRKDLHQTKQELEEFIDKVNRESHELFKATVEKVREHFNDIFRKIFGGGKADVVVEADPNIDPLDQGVEVVAKLPKKEISKLSLMSGGEKSLTAIALTLALFRVRPTAFCVLDECDAALDEANVTRYANLVKDFSQETQFVVITHNKRTMMVADKLYGITMSPPGVSRRVMVNFEGKPIEEKPKAEAKTEPPAASN